jgi:DNA-binding XRE family transcriptional regulator
MSQDIRHMSKGSQSALARELSVDRRRVHDWITGKSTPRLEQGIKIMAFLKKQRRRK